MLVKTLAISLLCLAVNAGVPSDRTDQSVGKQLAQVFLCSCDANNDKRISQQEMKTENCKKVLIGFLGIGTEKLSEMVRDDIIKGVQNREGQFKELDIDINIDGKFQVPLETALGGLEKIVRCSCEAATAADKKDDQCTAQELIDDKPVFNLVKLLFNLELTEGHVSMADCAGDKNGLIKASESLNFIKYGYKMLKDGELSEYEKKIRNCM